MWPFSKPRPGRVREVLLYTRQGCCLCEQAWLLLEKAQRRHGFTLASKDVDEDPALVEQFGHEVPVVVLDGKIFFRGLVNPVLLDRLLQGRAGAP